MNLASSQPTDPAHIDALERLATKTPQERVVQHLLAELRLTPPAWTDLLRKAVATIPLDDLNALVNERRCSDLGQQMADRCDQLTDPTGVRSPGGGGAPGRTRAPTGTSGAACGPGGALLDARAAPHPPRQTDR